MATSVLLDLLVIAVFIVFFIVGWRRGLISELLRIVGFAVALLAAWILSAPVTGWVYESFVKDKIVSQVSEKITTTVDGTALTGASFWEKLGDLGSEIASLVTVTPDQAAKLGEDFVNNSLAAPVQAIIRTIVFVILFALFLLVIKLVSRLFKGLNKLPVVGTVNRIFGGILGLAEGAVICYIFVAIAAIIVKVTGDELLWLNSDLINDSKLFSLLYNFNPVQAAIDSGIILTKEQTL